MSSLHTQSFAQNSHRAADVMSDDPMVAADADMAYVLDMLAGLEGRPIERCTPREARRQPSLADAARRLFEGSGRDPLAAGGVDVTDLTFEGAEGDLPARLYRPEGLPESGQAPVILFLHDGGWVMGDVETGAVTAHTLARRTGALVVTIGYRLAPEHKFPAAHDDCYAGWLWLTAQAAALGGDPATMAIVGEGVGANMAVDTALQAAAERQRRPVHVGLVTPVASNELARPSCVTALKARPLNTQMLRWSFRHAFHNKADAAEPRTNLVARDDLGRLPDTTLILAELDPLFSDGEALGEALHAAGVTLDATIYEGVSHGFFELPHIVNKAMFAHSQLSGNLAAAFAARQQRNG